jgi:hypothetical protein
LAAGFAAGSGFAVHSGGQGCEDHDVGFLERARREELRMNLWWILDTLMPVLIGLAMPLLAGKLVPWLFPGLMRRIVHELSVFLPSLRMEPWLFEPIVEADLPADQRAFFQQHTPALLMLGYQPLGDFVLRRDPAPSCSRHFLSRDGLSYAGLTCYLGVETIEAVSVALDGTYFETGNMSLPRTPPKEHGLRFFVCLTSDPRELVAFHRQSAEQAAAELGSELAPLDADDLVTVLNYGRRLALGSLHQEGVLDELPEFLREQEEPEVSANTGDGYALANK